MRYERKSNLINKKNTVLFSVLIIFVGLYLIKNIFFNTNFNDKILILEEPKSYNINIPAKSLIIKNEYLYFLGDNNLEFDNSKVQKNKEIGNVDVGVVDENFKKYLSEKVEYLTSKVDSNSKKKVFNSFEIVTSLREKNYSKVFNLIYQNQDTIQGNNNLKDKLLRYSIINDTMNTGKVVSKNSGIILNKLDGLENIYDFSIIDLLDENDFNFDIIKGQSEIKGIKIVDNLRFFMCLKVDADLVQDIELNQNMGVNFGNETNVGKVIRLEKQLNSSILVVEFSSGFDYIKDKRFMDVNIEKKLRKSFELPIKSVFKDNNDDYVYVTDNFNNISKKKVEIQYIDYLKGNVYVNSQNSNIGTFSNIIVDYESVKVGELSK